MKKLLYAVMAGLAAGSLYASCNGPYCWDANDNGTMTGVVSSKSHPIIASSTTIAGLTPGIGDLVICNTCVNAGLNSYALCFATTTTQGYYVLASSTSIRCQ